jgi:tetratricopeptide (TPR) repeat protein
MAGSKRRKRNPFVVTVAIGIAAIFVLGSALGLYLGIRGSKSPSGYIQSGREAASAGDYQKAEQEFRKALDLEKDNYDALVNLGIVLYYQGNKKEAVTYLKKALDEYPTTPDKAQIEQMINEAQ